MGISINNNIASLGVQRNLSVATTKLSKTFERLSSGLRINSASDDAAGLAIADGLRADARIAGQALLNANDGVSLVSIADSALEEIGNILSRMAELAEQSSNGTLSTTQRSALSSEFVALGSEVNRIAVTTEFNGIELLSGSADIALQVGLDSTSNSQITVQGVLGTLEAIGLSSAGSSKLSYSINDVNTAAAEAAALNALTAVRSAIDTVSLNRGTLGAAESRLSSAVSTLQVQRENLLTAESRIRDIDVANEAAELVRLQIIQQGAAAVLAQANQQPALALNLLQ